MLCVHVRWAQNKKVAKSNADKKSIWDRPDGGGKGFKKLTKGARESRLTSRVGNEITSQLNSNCLEEELSEGDPHMGA